MENQIHTEAARILDSITKLAPTDAGRVVIAGSHGGSYAAYCAARGRVRAVVLNDAGVGWQQAGIAGLDELQQWGVAAATADYRSCRIGDGADMARHGIISHVNGLAHALGCRPGMAVAQAARRLADADMAPTWPAPRHEARAVLATAADGTPRVIGADSVSLLEADDDGRIAVTASHGERLAGLATDGVRPRPWLVTFNDAGIGKDSAGIGRLPLLQQRGIAALTVSAHSARIGDARSCYEDGVVSCANARARELGCRIGAPLKSFIDALLAGRATHLEHSPHVGNP
ncbi:MAG: hypothetical protein J0I68_10050 [Achromobacter sp.]|jgi:hypothetical protein|uniref:Uncharacterized protein n=1 Tax=Achromobacter insuavis TaxID=1287735 RepID=A0A6J5BHC4_9BURK|nr:MULTISPECIES: hypothetical protein [Achromobacter]MBN9638873.1 hypothetical protein [Achromobacter sp.]CAB3706015.1 hypothetical protein LMG26845_05504 [Achromobacter insuavis]CUJ15733.1 Uncharacterised protein [Achromobacter sp. 2789STDY5608633]CUJ56747.1 Uncharacterised protein [Achromobacter sp. 2789STDY5608628]